ncbi:MAG: flagellar biosynthesis protein FlhB [Deltaproteobacteria bacterium]|nr:flagellar biosynthesis protein FlhB [Deltaproteobacteria bacterium]
MPKENEDGQERTEQPTAKRIRESREKGQVSKSMEVSTALLFFATIVSFYFYIPAVGMKMASAARMYIGNLLLWDGSQASLVEVFNNGVYLMAGMLMPILMVFLVVGVLSNISQTGFVISAEPIKPKLSKLNPLKGIKEKFFSFRGLEQLVKCIVILMVIALVSYQSIKKDFSYLPALINCDISVILLTFFRSVMHLLWNALWVFVFIALADFIFQRWQHKQDLMMTKVEVKEELKQTEGNPQIKSRIRSIQLHLARQRMIHEVPKADVVITNPTHLAIALQYVRGKMIAPVVLAKGAGKLAERIREVARDASIPIVENRPLAHALYTSVDVGEVIPEELYRAVAEILAYVYQIKGSSLNG